MRSRISDTGKWLGNYSDEFLITYYYDSLNGDFIYDWIFSDDVYDTELNYVLPYWDLENLVWYDGDGIEGIPPPPGYTSYEVDLDILRQETYDLLQPTDFYIIRSLDPTSGAEIPINILKERAEIRAAHEEQEQILKNTYNIE